MNHKTIKYVLDTKSELNYISNMCYGKYQLHIPVTILAIIRLHASYQVAVQCMWCIVGGRGLVYNGSGMNTELMDRLQIAHIWYTTNNVHQSKYVQSTVTSDRRVTER